MAAMLLAATAHAQLPQPGKNAIAASLVPESTVVAPGETLTLALVMRPAKGWHGYWKNPGDSGIETQIAWDMPPGFAAGPIQYPVPDRLIISGLMNYVYEGDYAQLIDVKVPAGLCARHQAADPRAGRLPCLHQGNLRARNGECRSRPGGWLGTVCSDNRAMFDRFRQALPKPLGSEARFERAETVPARHPGPGRTGAKRALFLPLDRRRAFLCGGADRLTRRRHIDRRDRGACERRQPRGGGGRAEAGTTATACR
jgi:hypothetical protein